MVFTPKPYSDNAYAEKNKLVSKTNDVLPEDNEAESKTNPVLQERI